nr:unnamed protein product [Callosobruchus chinensis]
MPAIFLGLISGQKENVHVHGGVCMYAWADVQCRAVDVKQYTREIHAEFCAVELSNKVVIITVTRSCAGDSEMFLQLFDRLLKDFSNIHLEAEDIIIMDNIDVFSMTVIITMLIRSHNIGLLIIEAIIQSIEAIIEPPARSTGEP